MHFGGLLMTRSVIANCMMVRDALLKFLTYQLSMERYWLTMVLTDNGELEFDPGEGAWEMAATSKEGSRRVNYPILAQWGSNKKYQYKAYMICSWNESNPNLLVSIDWRASLVPAAAVIPAPIAYIKIVAVKTLVVEHLPKNVGLPQRWVISIALAFYWVEHVRFSVWLRIPGHLLWGNERV